MGQRHCIALFPKPQFLFDFYTAVPVLTATSASLCSGQITGIALGVPASLIFCLAMFFLGVLYHRGLAIRRKRAMRRYLESGEVGALETHVVILLGYANLRYLRIILYCYCGRASSLLVRVRKEQKFTLAS